LGLKMNILSCVLLTIHQSDKSRPLRNYLCSLRSKRLSFELAAVRTLHRNCVRVAYGGPSLHEAHSQCTYCEVHTVSIRLSRVWIRRTLKHKDK
jgi:hypothetical protein